MFRLFAPLALAALAVHSAFARDGSAQDGSTPPSMERALVQADAARPLTLPDALDLAYAGHPDLAAARHEAEAVEGARQQAGAFPNPVLGLEVEDTRRENRTTTLLLSQPVEWGGKRAARIEAADRARDMAAAQIAIRRAEVRAGVTSAYFSALIAQERVRLSEASLALARSARDAAGKRVAAGKVSPIEETRARVAESGVALDLVQALSEREASRFALRAAIGSESAAVERLDGTAETLPAAFAEGVFEQRLAAAPVLRQAGFAIGRLGALARLEQARRTPDVTFSVGAKRTADASGRHQAVLGISVPLPLFDANRGNVEEALRREDQARDEAQALALRLRAEALEARQRQRTATTEAQALRREVLPDAQSAFDATVKGFELGKFSFLETLDAQRTLFQVRAQYLKALSEAHRAASDLDRLLGDAAEADFAPVSTPGKGAPR